MNAFAILALALLSGFVQPAAAQVTSVAQCAADFNWTANALGQSPCLVASYLEAQCAGNWTMPALPEGTTYEGPATSQATACSCSSVTYSLVSACGLCQECEGCSIGTWTDWIANCPATIVTLKTYPKTIPDETKVPAWAYQDVSKSNLFNISEAAVESGVTSTVISIPATTGAEASLTTTSGPGSAPATTTPASAVTTTPATAQTGGSTSLTVYASHALGLIILAMVWAA